MHGATVSECEILLGWHVLSFASGRHTPTRKAVGIAHHRVQARMYVGGGIICQARLGLDERGVGDAFFSDTNAA